MCVSFAIAVFFLHDLLHSKLDAPPPGWTDSPVKHFERALVGCGYFRYEICYLSVFTIHSAKFLTHTVY